MRAVICVYVVFLLTMNITAFVLYGSDKSKAKHGKWRISEKTLLSAGFFGGAVGALAGMKHFRHKTKHTYFWILNFTGLLWQIGLLIFLLSET